MNTPTPPSRDSERFGRFEIRYAERQLRVDGQPATLGSRAFDVLEALVRRRDRIVTKSELLDLVWPGVVVEDNNLQVQVSALRKLLGAQLITTIPGRGYRFTVPGAEAATPDRAPDRAPDRTTDRTTDPPTTRPAPHVGQPLAAAATSAPAQGAPRRLLVVDDNKVNRLLLARILEQMGHVVAQADNGQRAMEMVRAEPFDLLLLDLEMPELDGFSVLEQLAADPELRELPVIVASSVEGVPDIARCIELGADDFLRKPVNPVLLKARVTTSLEKKRLRDQQRELIQRLAAGAAAAAQPPAAPTAEAVRATATVMAASLHGLSALATAVDAADTASATGATPAIDAAELIQLVDSWHTLMLDAIAAHQGVVCQAGADSLVAVFGTPLQAPAPADAPLAAARAALEMAESFEIFNAERRAQGGAPLVMSLGLATGEVVAGYTGLPRRAAYACVGAAVDLARRLERHAQAAGVSIAIDSPTRRALAGRIATEPLAALPAASGTGAKKAASVEAHAIKAT